jgi:hypothetical protein
MNNHIFKKVVGGSALVYALILFTLYLNQDDRPLPDVLPLSWQAVFLVDGQVYFGHLEENNRGFAQLTSVYYLKSGSRLQQENLNQTATSSKNFNLVKLGGEIHGPEDKMYIAKDKILIVETLKDSSVVVQTIKKQQ